MTVESRAGVSATDATLTLRHAQPRRARRMSAAGTIDCEWLIPAMAAAAPARAASANLNLAGGQASPPTQVTLDVSGTRRGRRRPIAHALRRRCSSTPFQAGDGRGGTGNFLITGGTATLGALDARRAGGTGGQIGQRCGSAPSDAGGGAGGRSGAAALRRYSNRAAARCSSAALSIDASGTGGDGYSTYQNDGSDGGAGIGGSARLLLTAGGNGLVSVDNGIVIGAAGVGGNGAGTYADASGTYRAGNGGSGTGGGVDATLAGGTLTAPSLLVSAGGSGGSGGENGTDGAGGAAGNGIGGTATLAYRNEGHVIGSIAVNASGQGGQAGSTGQIIGYDSNDQPIYAYGIGAGGQGGRGAGGTANVLIDVDPSYGSLTVSADGVGSIGASGGTGGAGGIGAGGTAALNITFGATSVSDALRVTASGDGGMGGSGYYGAGGRGGDAQAGSATLGVAGASASLAAGNIAVLAEARGGAGGIGGLQGVTGLPGAAGGNAIGGTALFAVTGGGSAAPGGALIVSADAIGGAGAAGTAGPSGGAGGAGGNATAGSATLRIADGHLIGGGSGANYLITATGQGGAGADGSAGGNAGLSGGIGGAGGNGTGGTASFDAANGDYALGGLDIVADGLGGTAGAGGAGPGGASAAGAIGAGSGGTASFANSDSGVLASGALRQLESLAMRANGDAAGRVVFADTSSAANGGLRINGALTLTSLGAPVTGFSGIFVSATANPVQIGGDAAFDTDGPLGFAFSGGGGLNAVGALTGRSGTRIDISHNGRPAGADSLVADTISLTAPGDISMSSPGSLRATNGVTISSAGGRIDFATGSMINAGGNVTLTAQGISVAGLTSGGQALLDAGAGSLSVSNLAAANPITAYGQGISLSGPGALAIALANAGTGSLTLNAGSLDATALVATGAVAATTTGNARFGDVTSTSGGITLNAGGVASLSGTISGRTIAIGSSDVVIAATASIGVPGTTTGVTFTSVNTGAPAYIGGGDMAGGYSLSAAEIARVAAGNISIVGSNAGVIVRDLTIGTNVLPGTGVLSISTPGRLSVEGALAMTGRTGQGGLTLSAGDTLAVVAGAGSIDLRDPAGVLGGVLNLRGRTIIAASSAAIADVAAAPTLDARERRLAQNDGSVSDAGIIRAGAINAAAADGLFIQNTGSGTEFADRRGFTANSFAITTTGQTQIAINGRLTGPGGFVIGRDTGPQTSINGVLDGRAGGFFIGSTVNGCLIGTAGACANLDSALASHGILEGELNPAAALPRPLSLSLIELWDVMEQGFPPLIDEPVTGAGNEDLWTQPCGGAGESACSGNATP
ncbi:MAG: hypothetical protein P0Y64_04215 [Candidatus Sphingomonas colombiensis]|nr:hypothetical protein [Sphingomonas sp.]WEK44044.1 MAG: hypothetical protein P0Y64_04215 [Sphingomonas sp.]